MPGMKRWALGIVVTLGTAIFLFSAWNCFASHSQIRRCESGVILVLGAWRPFQSDLLTRLSTAANRSGPISSATIQHTKAFIYGGGSVCSPVFYPSKRVLICPLRRLKTHWTAV